MIVKLLFQDFSWLDVLDISLVALSIYFFLRLIKGTRALQIFYGILPVVLLWLIAYFFRFVALMRLISFLIPVVGVAFVVVFQPELRRMLSQIGQWNIAKRRVGSFESATLDEIMAAIKAMSSNNVGAIIVMTREAEIDTQLSNQGVPLDARVTRELLVSIFNTTSPLHDGAVIVRENRITHAGAILPLSDELKLSGKFGTRHRAAIGLSEETDALVIVVSEESGNISLAHSNLLEGPYKPKDVIKRIQELSLSERVSNAQKHAASKEVSA